MKYSKGTFVGLAVLTACQNPNSFNDVVYFTGTESSAVKSISTEQPTSIGLSITASCKMEQKLVATLKVVEEKVESYNQKEGTNYQLLPANFYQLSAEACTIEIGEAVSKPIELTILNVDKFEPEVTYLLPISLNDIPNGLPILEASRTIYIIVSKPLITAAANISGKYYQIPFNEDATLSGLTQLSYEARVRINKFAPYSPYISTLMGIEGHFCFRFGDVAIKPNQLQIAGKGVETTAPTEFTTGKWYHVAAVFDGVNVKIYIDGELAVSKATSASAIDLTDKRLFYIGRSSGGRLLSGDISEVRVWKKALTLKEITNNMCGVNPLTEGLVAYWRFNEGEGSMVKDWTGHGWDINKAVTWIDGVRCPGN